MKYRLTIKGILPNLNDYVNAERTNRFKGAKMKKDAEEYIMLCIRSQLHGLNIDVPVFLNYTFYEPNKRRDKDNISAFAAKVIQDSLVKSGVLKDDGWNEIIGFDYRFDVDKKNPRIEIEIVEQS